MSIEITWTITAIIAVSSFLSPIAVAIINNRHNAKIRKLELKNASHLKTLEYQQYLVDKQLNIYYIDKKESFSVFLCKAGNILCHTTNITSLSNLYSAAHSAILFCTKENRQKIVYFLDYVNKLPPNLSPDLLNEFNKQLTEISTALNAELLSTASEVIHNSYICQEK